MACDYPDQTPYPLDDKERKVVLHLYAVQAENDGLIKIGIAKDVKSRLEQLRRGSPVQLDLLGVYPNATHADEAMFHQLLYPYREYGEWFRPEEEVITTLATKFKRPERVGLGLIT